MEHRVLNRLLKKHDLSLDRLPASLDGWRQLLERIARTFHAADQDRYLLERSLSISSREMQELHESLRQHMMAELDRLRAVISSLGAGLCTLAPDGRVRSVNPEGERLLGYAEAELVNTHFTRHIEPVRREAEPDAASTPSLAKSIANGHPYRDEDGTFLRKDGTTIPVSYTLNPIVEAGTLRGAVLVFFDITEQKKAAATLQEQRRFLRQVIDINPSFIFAKDREGRFTLVNKATAEVYGTTVEDLVGKTDAAFNPNPDEVEHFRRDDLEVINTLREKFIAEESITDAAGRTRWLQTIKRPILNIENEADQVLGVSTDITERKVAEQALQRYAGQLEDAKSALEEQTARLSQMVYELEEAKSQAEESARLKANILNNMSHEIRTPITAILGYAEILAEELDDEHSEFVNHIDLNGKRLLDTLNAILDLSKFEAAGSSMPLATLDLGEVAGNCVSILTPQAIRKKLVLRLVRPERPVEVHADADALDRILHNLIGNAIKFTDTGEIVVEVGMDPQHTYLRVRDTGVGISEQFLPHIFEEFKQESSGLARSHEGSGLGLAITRRLIEAMRGEITVESEKGTGTVFNILFPCSSRHASRSALSCTVPFPGQAKPAR